MPLPRKKLTQQTTADTKLWLLKLFNAPVLSQLSDMTVSPFHPGFALYSTLITLLSGVSSVHRGMTMHNKHIRFSPLWSLSAQDVQFIRVFLSSVRSAHPDLTKHTVRSFRRGPRHYGVIKHNHSGSPWSS